MIFGMWNRNKENIIYAIVTIFLLERVRTGWNRAETSGRKAGAARPDIELRQDRLVVKASLLYALPFVLPIVKYIYRSLAELSDTVNGIAVMKSIWAFFGVSVIVECFVALVIYNLLKIYIDRMNSAIGFFSKIGRNIWDGSKMAVQASGDIGSRVARGIGGLLGSVWQTSKGVGRATGRIATRLPGSAVDRLRGVRLMRRGQRVGVTTRT